MLAIVAHCLILEFGVDLLGFLLFANKVYEQRHAVPDLCLPLSLALRQLQVCLATHYLSAGRADFGAAQDRQSLPRCDAIARTDLKFPHDAIERRFHGDMAILIVGQAPWRRSRWLQTR